MANARHTTTMKGNSHELQMEPRNIQAQVGSAFSWISSMTGTDLEMSRATTQLLPLHQWASSAVDTTSNKEVTAFISRRGAESSESNKLANSYPASRRPLSAWP